MKIYKATLDNFMSFHHGKVYKKEQVYTPAQLLSITLNDVYDGWISGALGLLIRLLMPIKLWYGQNFEILEESLVVVWWNGVGLGKVSHSETNSEKTSKLLSSRCLWQRDKASVFSAFLDPGVIFKKMELGMMDWVDRRFGDRAVNGYSMALTSLLREAIKMKAAQDEGKSWKQDFIES